MKRINPYKLFVGSFVPNWLMERTEVSAGAKLCYARLAQHAGENGECYPSQETVGKEMGVVDRQVRRYVEELATAGLLEIEQQGMKRVNHYYFLAHAWMSSCKRTDVSSSTGTDMSGHKRTDVSSIKESKEENQLKEKAPSSRFTPPNEEEMKEYGETIKLSLLEIENCRDHYISNGWKVGRNPMKDWRASMRTWARNVGQFGNGKTTAPVNGKPVISRGY